jgi:Domain of unknown function (DUF4331)
MFGQKLKRKSVKIKNRFIILKYKNMKAINIRKVISSLALPVLVLIVLSSCQKDLKNNISLNDDQLSVNPNTESDNPPFADMYEQMDQMGRPAINTVFVGASRKNEFNTTIPSAMTAAFNSDFVNKLNAFGYVSNILGLNINQFAGVLVKDILGASTTGVTTFYDGTNVLTGRNLSDDVIDVELILIFGGATGGSNPGLTSDHVDANDKPFLASFPYMAAPF